MSTPPFRLSDHLTIFRNPQFREKQKIVNKVIKKRDTRPSKLSSLGRFPSEIPWLDLLSLVQSSNDKLSVFTDIITYGLNLIMPEQSITVHLNDCYWITTELKSLILRRQSAFNSGNVILFKILRNKGK